MRPFPPELQAAYPCPPDRLPDRPWWRKETWSIDASSLRSSHFRRQDGRLAVFLEEVAAIDASDPLPHPGFRVGQVWANHDGATVVQIGATWVLHGERIWMPGPAVGKASGLTICRDVGEDPPEPEEQPAPAGVFVVRLSSKPPTRINHLLSSYFLLADPACPHLAPWAPV